MRSRSIPALSITIYDLPMLYKDHSSTMDSMYIPNNPQYGLQLEYTTSSFNPQSPTPPSLPLLPPLPPHPGGKHHPTDYSNFNNFDSPIIICDHDQINNDLGNEDQVNPELLCNCEHICCCNSGVVLDDTGQDQQGQQVCEGVSEIDLCGENSDNDLCNDGRVDGGLIGHSGYSVNPYSNNTGQYWSTDVDMGTFSLPPLDLDPLPSLFPFSPCSANNFK